MKKLTTDLRYQINITSFWFLLSLSLLVLNDESEGAERAAEKGAQPTGKSDAKKTGDAEKPKQVLMPQNLDSDRHKIVILGSGTRKTKESY